MLLKLVGYIVVLYNKYKIYIYGIKKIFNILEIE